MWKAGPVYASLDLLRDIVAEHLDREETRVLCDYHQERIADSIVGRTGAPPAETTIAGFLNGFRTAAFGLTDDRHLTADTIHPYLGGIYLTAVATLEQHAADRAAEAAADGFFARLTVMLNQEPSYRDLTDDQHRSAQRLVREAFAETPDVPVTGASLVGFILGVLYAQPFVAQRGIVPALALMGAAESLRTAS